LYHARDEKSANADGLKLEESLFRKQVVLKHTAEHLLGKFEILFSDYFRNEFAIKTEKAVAVATGQALHNVFQDTRRSYL
jgi:hypothetical protein